jgi:protein O-mannosyl-transferase
MKSPKQHGNNTLDSGTPAAGDPRHRTREWIPAVVMITVVFGACSRALEGSFFWDDGPLILANPNVRNGATLGSWFLKPFWEAGPVLLEPRGLYRPLTLLSYRLDWLLHGENATGFHATNLAIHLLNALLLYWVARRLSAPSLAAALAAGCWGVLPRLTECSAWISGRTDMLALAAVLLAFLAWPWRPAQGATPSRSIRPALAAALIFAGLLCKEVAVAGWVAIVAAELWRSRRDAQPLRCAPLAGLVGVLALYGCMRVVALGAAQTFPEMLTPGRRMVRILGAAGTYLTMIADPLSPNAQIGAVDDPGGVAMTLGVLMLAGLVAAGAVLWRRGNSELFGVYAMGAVSLLAVFHFVSMPLNVIAADRFLYAPMAALALGVSIWAGQWGARTAKIAAAAACAWVVTGAYLTWERVEVWNNPAWFWVETGEHAHRMNHIPAQELAGVLLKEGYFPEATTLYGVALRILAMQGLQDTALGRIVMTNLAEGLAYDGKYEEAIAVWEYMVGASPELSHGWFRIGRMEARMGLWGEANAHTQKAALLAPSDPRIQAQRKVLPEWERVAREMPDEQAAQADETKAFERARALSSLERVPEAERLWRRLLQKPAHARVLQEGLQFFAEDMPERDCAWALGVLRRSSAQGAEFEALRLVLERRAESAARVEMLIPRIRGWIQQLVARTQPVLPGQIEPPAGAR